MGLLATVLQAAERGPLPDFLIRAGLRRQAGRKQRQLLGLEDRDADFARRMDGRPVAEHPAAADRQPELPSSFFGLILGPRRKYSCCLYDAADTTLAAAEMRALEETAAHADLADGQHILELGCGWGSLTLFIAARYPNATVTAVSTLTPQRLYIEGEVKARGLTNIRVVTADMNRFHPFGTFDRVVSVEMFERISNWRILLARIRGWLKPDGLLFVHTATHLRQPYRFDEAAFTDRITQHILAGGIMPSHGLIRQFPESFTVEQEWRWSGRHYRRTAMDWLANFDASRPAIDGILTDIYGPDAPLWRRRWRLFFLATADLFGHADGNEWAVSRYRLRPTSG